jgi:glycerophosphoryl diester phosphodiesterase
VLVKSGKAGKASATGKGIVRITAAGKNHWNIRTLKPGQTTIKVKQKKKNFKCKVTVLPYRIGKKSSLFIGHRGYAEKYPENTGIALRKAMQAGFRGVAFDLIPTKPDPKGQFDFAVSHDDLLKKMTSQKGFVRAKTAQQIRKLKVTKGRNAGKYKQKMILLREAVDITRKANAIAQIEMKDVWTTAQTDRLASMLKAWNVPENWQIEAVDESTLRRFDQSQQKYGLNLALNLVVQKAMDPYQKIDQARACGFDNIHINVVRVNKKVVDYSRKKEIGIGGYAGMHTDANEVAKKMEPFQLDWLCVSDIPWYQ